MKFQEFQKIAEKFNRLDELSLEVKSIERGKSLLQMSLGDAKYKMRISNIAGQTLEMEFHTSDIQEYLTPLLKIKQQEFNALQSELDAIKIQQQINK